MAEFIVPFSLQRSVLELVVQQSFSFLRPKMEGGKILWGYLGGTVD